jgi:hypothetical protein
MPGCLARAQLPTFHAADSAVAPTLCSPLPSGPWWRAGRSSTSPPIAGNIPAESHEESRPSDRAAGGRRDPRCRCRTRLCRHAKPRHPLRKRVRRRQRQCVDGPSARARSRATLQHGDAGQRRNRGRWPATGGVDLGPEPARRWSSARPSRSAGTCHNAEQGATPTGRRVCGVYSQRDPKRTS